MKSNKAFRIIMIIGAVLLLIGLTIASLGIWNSGMWFWNNGSDGQRHGDANSWGNLTNYELWVDEPIDSVSLELVYGKITFVVSDTKAGIEIKDYAAGRITLEMVNNELRAHDNDWMVNTYNIHTTPNITVYLNQDTLNKLDISVGAGDIDIDAITADTISIYTGAGDFDINNVNATTVTFEGGAGDVSFEDCMIGSLTVSVGAGDLDFTGDITQSATFECGAGNLNIILAGHEADYAFDVSYGVGAFRLNGKSHSWIGEDNTYGNPGADVRIDVSAGAGDVTITTA